MAMAVITVASGGLPVTDVTATKPALGMAVTEAIAVGTAKWGRAVTKVPNGLPVTFVTAGNEWPSGGGGFTTGFENFTGSNLPKWTTARAAVVAGTRDAKVIDYGDSTVAGFGATAGHINAAAYSRMAALVPLLGVNASASSFFSDHHIAQISAVALNVFDSRIALGSFVSGGGASFSFGGALVSSSAATNPLTFTPTDQISRYDFYYAAFTGNGTLRYGVDALGTTNISTNAAAAIVKVSDTVALGNHTLKFWWQSGGSVYVMGVIGYGTAKQVALINTGVVSATTTNLVTVTGFPWDPLETLKVVAPDLTIVEGGVINNWDAAVSVAQTTTDLQTMITAAKVSGDVILISPNPTKVADTVSYATQQTYVDAMKALAVSNNVPFIDLWRLFGTWEAAQANGYNFDSWHLNAAGYARVAAYLAQAMGSGFVSVAPAGLEAAA